MFVLDETSYEQIVRLVYWNEIFDLNIVADFYLFDWLALIRSIQNILSSVK